MDFIFGFPGENSTDRRETLQFIKRLATEYQAMIQLHYFLPLAGTLYANAVPRPLDYQTIDILIHRTFRL